jgi:hypothetical protein
MHQRSRKMAFIETQAANRNQLSICQLKPLNSATWQEEIEEVLASAGQAPGNRPADPDWQEASHFLVRHCREALSFREIP